MSALKVILVRSQAIDPAVNKVAKALTENGYVVTLLVWSREGRGAQKEMGDSYHLRRFTLKAPYYEPRLLLYLPIWWLYELFFLLRHKVNVIHACDLDTLIPAIVVKVLKKTKLYYSIYDFYADNLPRKVPNLLRRLVSFTERFCLRFVDVLFLVDESRYEQVNGAKIKRIEYIYNSPEDRLRTRVELQHASDINRINIFYAGVIHKSRGLQETIKAVAELEGIKLTLAGRGTDEALIEPYLAKSHNLEYIGWIPYEEVLTRELEADILFAFYDPSIPNNKYASPNKLFEAMMCGKPIIVNEGTTASKIVAKEQCGIVVPYGDISAIRAAVLRFKSDPALCRQMGNNGRQAYETHYSWEIMKARLIDAYQVIITNTVPS